MPCEAQEHSGGRTASARSARPPLSSERSTSMQLVGAASASMCSAMRQAAK
jgi:hypothetical protein